MLGLPPVPLHLGWQHRIRLGRTYHVRLDCTDYSVQPHAIGRFVDIHADLDRVRVRCAARLVGDHAQIWARGLTITAPGHVVAAKALRAAFRAGHATGRPAAEQDLVRDLGDYDRAFGLLDVQVS